MFAIHVKDIFSDDDILPISEEKVSAIFAHAFCDVSLEKLFALLICKTGTRRGGVNL